jgi:DNA-binding transcriptional regulator LsrR (DeoR family)
MPNHKSEDYKLSAVDYYLTEDKTQEEVCKIFKCSARSLMRWVDKYKKDGEIKRHNRTPVARSFAFSMGVMVFSLGCWLSGHFALHCTRQIFRH